MLKQTLIFTLMLLTVATFCPTNSFGDGVAETVSDPSLILWLSFDELNGNRVIDHSQHGNHGAVVGNRQLVAGRFGNALTFNGVSDWVEIPHHNSLTVDTSVTVMAWINTPRSHGPNGAEWQGIIAKNNDFRSYSFYTAPGDLVHLSVGENLGAGSRETNRTFALNTWQHVAAQMDSNGVQRYWINGERAGNFQLGNTLPGLRDTANVLVGKTHEDNREFLGMIDEVRVWNRALSEAEILEQMTIGYGGDDPPVTGVYMYWTDSVTGKIQRANLDGTNIEDLVTTELQSHKDIELDIAGNKMYWVVPNAHKVQRANLDGTNVEDFINTQGPPFGIAVDTTNGKMYWSIWNPGKIRRANLDGTNVEDFVTGLSEPEDIDLDISGGKIYWTDTVTNKIQRANLDGSNIEDLVTVGLSHPLGLTLDVAGGKMYWTNTSFFPWGGPGLDKIQRANLDGSNVEDLVTTGLVLAIDIALDVASGKMYWTDCGTVKIQRANLDGTNIEDLIMTGLSCPDGLALGIPRAPPSDGLRFSPNMIADQTFTVSTYASVPLPVAIGGTPPYTYTVSALPPGLQFDSVNRFLSGTPTTTGTTDVTYTATDATSASASLPFTITVTESGGAPLDINGDGQVTVLDLAVVALLYGTRVPVGVSLLADVNADGVVDILDLTAVAQGIDAASGGLNQLSLWEVKAALLAAAEQAAEIGAVAGAPMGFGTGQHALSNGIAYGNVAAALADARRMTVDDVRLGKGMAVLEGLLQLLVEMGAIPETTALLPNYPNPFNPETWFPYQLANAADVTLTIYDMRGIAVRELVLGHQPAGVYQSRGRAAYWDGRNELGEPVASGVYFYTLTAGDFTATRKLMIRK